MREAENVAKDSGESMDIIEEDEYDNPLSTTCCYARIANKYRKHSGVPYILGYKGGVLPKGTVWKESSLMLIDACKVAGSDIIYDGDLYDRKDFRSPEDSE